MRVRQRLAISFLALAAFLSLPAADQLAAVSATSLVGCPAQPGYDYRILGAAGPPAATPLGGDRVAFVASGSGRQAYAVATGIGVDPLNVGPLECYGGAAVDNPAVVSRGGVLILLARSADGRVYQRTVTAAGALPGTVSPPGAGTGEPVESAWTVVPGVVSTAGPAAAVTPDGRLHLLVRGTDGELYHLVQQRGSPVWSRPERLGGQVVGTPAVAPGPFGGLVVVVRGRQDRIEARYGDTGRWSGWARLPGTTKAGPAMAFGFAPGRVELFVSGSTGGLRHAIYTSGRWTPWQRIDSTLPATARLAAAATPGHLIVFAQSGSMLGYTQFLSGWQPYHQAPYTCDQCRPVVG